ncbi:MAG: hypothetical protein GX025_01855 [Clostridiales bacterium]|nr:hypothetical protein [Clostridiales bacterium]
MFILVLLLCVGTIFYDALTLLKNLNRREKFIYFFMMGLGFVVLSLYSFKIDLPSPSDGIIRVLNSIFKIDNSSLPL